jgi:hypothetical protein
VTVTVNYGLRYEHYGVQHKENQSLDSNFYYGAGSTLFKQIANGQVMTAAQSSTGQLWSPRWSQQHRARRRPRRTPLRPACRSRSHLNVKGVRINIVPAP